MIPVLKNAPDTAVLSADFLSLLKLSIPNLHNVKMLDLLASSNDGLSMTQICDKINRSKPLINLIKKLKEIIFYLFLSMKTLCLHLGA